MEATFAPYASAEFERIRAKNARHRVTAELNPQAFLEAEQAFLKFVEGDEALNRVAAGAMATARQFGLPPTRWPATGQFEAMVPFAKLREAGERFANQWASVYRIDIGALVHRLEVASVSQIIPRCLAILGRPGRESREGAGVLAGMLAMHPQAMKRIEAQDWWETADTVVRERAAAHATWKVMGEADHRQMEEIKSRHVHLFAGRNIAGVLFFLSEAPLVLWHSAVAEVRVQREAETKIEKRLPEVSVKTEIPAWLLRRARGRGPVSIVLDAFGLPLLKDPLGSIAASVVERMQAEKGDLMADWALAAFAEKILVTTARHAALSQIVRTSSPQYAPHLAKCLAAAYAHDLGYLETAGKVSPYSSKCLMWSATARGWIVASGLLPGVLQKGRGRDVPLLVA